MYGAILGDMIGAPYEFDRKRQVCGRIDVCEKMYVGFYGIQRTFLHRGNTGHDSGGDQAASKDPGMGVKGAGLQKQRIECTGMVPGKRSVINHLLQVGEYSAGGY